MWAKKEIDEAGYGLTELLVSLPTLIMLLAVTAFLTLWLYQNYRMQLADLELQAEIQLTMERIVEEAHRGSRYVITENGVGSKLTIYRREDSWHGNRVTFAEETVSFELLAYSGGGHRLVLNQASWPLTGDSDSGLVNISRFYCRSDGAILHLELEGRSRFTGHSFALTTDVYFPEMRDEL
ncbi:MAG: hypothetical protein IJ849_11255 [Selenomonadaceae bacterium]|nr:hypothetical protein [Selenomonadaceae bacterium]